MSKTAQNLFVGLLSILVLIFSGGDKFGAACAHVALVKTTPKNGATLGESPQVITLKFSGKPVAVAAKLSNKAGEQLDKLDEPVLDGRVVGITLTERLPNGSYKLSFRASSKDAHVVEGAIAFTVQADK